MSWSLFGKKAPEGGGDPQRRRLYLTISIPLEQVASGEFERHIAVWGKETAEGSARFRGDLAAIANWLVQSFERLRWVIDQQHARVAEVNRLVHEYPAFKGFDRKIGDETEWTAKKLSDTLAVIDGHAKAFRGYGSGSASTAALIEGLQQDLSRPAGQARGFAQKAIAALEYWEREGTGGVSAEYAELDREMQAFLDRHDPAKFGN